MIECFAPGFMRRFFVGSVTAWALAALPFFGVAFAARDNPGQPVELSRQLVSVRGAHGGQDLHGLLCNPEVPKLDNPKLRLALDNFETAGCRFLYIIRGKTR